MGHESQIEPWSPFDQRSACWFRNWQAPLQTSDENRWPEKTQTTGPPCPATEIMARQVRTDLVRSSGLRSKKNSSLGGGFSLDFFLYRTNQELATYRRGDRGRQLVPTSDDPGSWWAF